MIWSFLPRCYKNIICIKFSIVDARGCILLLFLAINCTYFHWKASMGKPNCAPIRINCILFRKYECRNFGLSFHTACFACDFSSARIKWEGAFLSPETMKTDTRPHATNNSHSRPFSDKNKKKMIIYILRFSNAMSARRYSSVLRRYQLICLFILTRGRFHALIAERDFIRNRIWKNILTFIQVSTW
jgi:hypothetical protein